MFPIRDDNPHFLTPYATYVIIGLNAIVWVLLQGLGAPEALAGSICTLGLIPGEFLQTIPAGAELQVGPNTVCLLGGDLSWYTPLTSMFSHGGWMHIIGNMWFLWIFGNNVEDAMGTVRFVVFYLLCGLIAAAAQVATNPESPIPMVGASGAIGGVMGAYIVLYPRVKVHMLFFFGIVTTFAVPAFVMLGYWLVVQLVSGVNSFGGAGGGVAFWAHIGGFVAGAVLVLLFRNPSLVAKHPYHGWKQGQSPSRSWHRIGRR